MVDRVKNNIVTLQKKHILSGKARPPEGNELRCALKGIPYRAKHAVLKGISCGVSFRAWFFKRMSDGAKKLYGVDESIKACRYSGK